MRPTLKSEGNACRVIRSWTLQRIREDQFSGKPFNQKEFDHYSELISESMEGISLMMPSSFADLIELNVSALRTTLTCFSDFAMSNHLEKKIPLFKAPAVQNEIAKERISNASE
jgi:hypothetical protein